MSKHDLLFFFVSGTFSIYSWIYRAVCFLEAFHENLDVILNIYEEFIYLGLILSL